MVIGFQSKEAASRPESERESIDRSERLLANLSIGRVLCPVCGVSYQALREMLNSPAWEDRVTAQIMIENEITCKGVRR